MLFYVNIYGSYKLLKTVRFLAHPVYCAIFCFAEFSIVYGRFQKSVRSVATDFICGIGYGRAVPQRGPGQNPGKSFGSLDAETFLYVQISACHERKSAINIWECVLTITN